MRTKIALAALSAMIMWASACDFSGNDKHEKELFDKIKVGMTKDEVMGILGVPDTTTIGSGPEKNHYYYYFIASKNVMRSELPTVMFDSSNLVKFVTYGD